MRVLLSIKPEYAEKILNGTKRFEYRKSAPRNEAVRTVVIYATMPVGKVVGEFEVAGVLRESPDALWKQTKTASGITRKFFDEYFSGRSSTLRKPEHFGPVLTRPVSHGDPCALLAVEVAAQGAEVRPLQLGPPPYPFGASPKTRRPPRPRGGASP